jgi:hypothetical protein
MEVNKMSDYQPNRLGIGTDAKFINEAWTWMGVPDNVELMKVASDDGSPALLGVRERLIAEFGERLHDGRRRQHFGQMAKQILEKEGYSIAQREVTINAYPFSVATRFEHSDRSKLFIYRSTSNARDVCVTLDKPAKNLPENSTKWKYWTFVISSIETSILLEQTREKLIQEIKRNGYARAALHRAVRAVGA